MKKQSFMKGRDCCYKWSYKLREPSLNSFKIHDFTNYDFYVPLITELNNLHVYIPTGLNTQLNDRMTSFPVYFRFIGC